MNNVMEPDKGNQDDEQVIQVLRQTFEELQTPDGGFSWSSQDVGGVRLRVFDKALPSMRSVWELATVHGDKPYLAYEGELVTYSKANDMICSLAGQLVERYGIGRHDRVAIAMRNYPEWIIAYWAVVAIGATVVGVNAWWTGPEMAYALNDSEPKLLIADAERIERITPHLAELAGNATFDGKVIALRSGTLGADFDTWESVIADGMGQALPEVEIDPDDDVCIFYTSGTTSRPKGARLSHRGSVHNLMHMAYSLMSSRLAHAKLEALEAGVDAGNEVQDQSAAEPVIMVPTPLFHVTACNCVMHPGTLLGAKLVLLHKWDPTRALELIEREKVTSFTGVPSMSREMLNHPDWHIRDTSSLESMGGGGASLQPDLVHMIDSASGGVRPSTGYGLTETHGIITALAGIFFTTHPDSAGPIAPTFEYKVVDENGVEQPSGALGELCVRGPAVIRGYLNRSADPQLDSNQGWFHTGDIVRVDDDGFVYVVDRAKDVVIRGGENVYSVEVESAIHELDAVAEVAVFGIPDERLGEIVVAAVVSRQNMKLSEADILNHLHDRLARYKHPERIWFLDRALPRNANGKFLKRELRDELLEMPS